MQLFPLYSIGKSLAAATAVALAIDLDAAVGDFVAVPERFRRARVRDVLRHRAGLPDYGGWPEYQVAIRESSPWRFDELMDRAARAAVPAPGTFHYSNAGYAIIRSILEEITGATFFETIRATLLAPLGITEVGPFAEPDDWRACVASESDVTWYHPGWVLTGTIAASQVATEELFAGILSGRLFDPAPLLETLPVDAPGTALPEPGYALGLMTSGLPEARYAGHGGGGPGFTTFVLATADGGAARASFSPGAVDQNALIRDCRDALEALEALEARDGRLTG
ncbi:CubicO group peptidase (beta-lactamase class C family) [Cryobacterium mesophilum]|uniref:serine hydrolase n=1 Tax=Terrimesophilobacter mesophilus TaxID=433647 RepID=UPI001425783D|nr:serine hydrolase [Terrimesophilobacter mesophilus]MBB5632497.1 CubicO group peptidase (beta-lactamase class C family) [Terrimesophilobacter mesophilus]